MRYRVLGRTGLKVSELGIGGHEYRRWLNPQHFPAEWNRKRFLETQLQRNKLIERAIDAGVNFFDTTLPAEAESLGFALKALGRRKDVHVSAMMVSPFKTLRESPASGWRDIVSGWVEERLRLLQTDYIDVFNIHLPENDYSRERLKVTLQVLGEIKDQGKIRAVGASCHAPKFLAELMRKYDCFDSVMIRYNYQLQEAREAIFPLCKALDVGIVVMKPFSWPYYGISFSRFCPADVKAGGYTPVQTSLRGVLSSPEVTTVVMGINGLDELEENLAAIGKEGKLDEEVLKLCLEIAQGSEGRKRLRELVKHPAIDISAYAKRALEEGN